MGKIVRKTVKFKTPKKGLMLYRVGLGQWVVCGGKVLMALGSRLDGYVATSDGLFWHPSGMRRATVMEVLGALTLARKQFAKEWLKAAQEEAARRGLKVSRAKLIEAMQEGLLPVQAATRGM